jgi:hypothetical protein
MSALEIPARIPAAELAAAMAADPVFALAFFDAYARACQYHPAAGVAGYRGGIDAARLAVFLREIAGGLDHFSDP